MWYILDKCMLAITCSFVIFHSFRAYFMPLCWEQVLAPDSSSSPSAEHGWAPQLQMDESPGESLGKGGQDTMKCPEIIMLKLF